MIQEQDKAEFIGQIIDIFEDFLEERGVEITNPERDEDSDAAILYGTDYDELQNSIAETMSSWGVFGKEAQG